MRQPLDEFPPRPSRERQRVDRQDPFQVGKDHLHHFDALAGGTRPPHGPFAVRVDAARIARGSFAFRKRLQDGLALRRELLHLHAALLQLLQLPLGFLGQAPVRRSGQLEQHLLPGGAPRRVHQRKREHLRQRRDLRGHAARVGPRKARGLRHGLRLQLRQRVARRLHLRRQGPRDACALHLLGDAVRTERVVLEQRKAFVDGQVVGYSHEGCGQ